MKAFIVVTGSDTGGCVARITEAFHKHQNAPLGAYRWSVRSMVASLNYIAYPRDLPYDRELIGQWYDAADVVQLGSTMHGHEWYDDGQGKPTVLMHHGVHEAGQHFSQGIREVAAEAFELGAVQIGSTVNLELYGPIQWAPTPYDLDALRAMRDSLYESDRSSRRKIITIGHAPTDRAIKSTDAVIRAVHNLREEGLPVELLLIEGRTHAQTLELKAKHVDIFVDQLKLGYGNNAIEAWGMGIPVVGGVSAYPEWREHMVKRYELESPSGLPFYEANEENLEEKLKTLVESLPLRVEWGAIGWNHAEKWHSQQSGVQIYSDIYDRTVGLHTKPSDPALSKRKARLGLTHAEKLQRLRNAREQRLASHKKGPNVALEHPSQV